MKVLVATDGSEHSMKAVQRGLELAEKQGAQVTLMSVTYYGGDLEGMPNIQEKLESEAKARVGKSQSLVYGQKPAGGDGAEGGAGAG